MSLLRIRTLLRAVALLAAATAISGCMEGRDAYAVTDSGTMIKFQTDDPGSIDNEVTITGLDNGETLLQIDFRIENGTLYGLTSSNRIATIDVDTGVATLVSATPFVSDATLTQPVMDINPALDFIRVIDYQTGTSETDTSILRVDPDTGALIQSDGVELRYNDSDDNDGETPQLAAIAYSNNDADATTTTLYGLDFTTQNLVRITNAGVLTSLGVLDRQFVASAGFDIVRERGDNPDELGIAYVAIAERNGSARFYELDLSDGNTSDTASNTGGATIGGDRQIRSVAVSPSPPKRDGLQF